MSMKRRVTEKLLMPVVAAGTSVAASYVVKKGPDFVENKLLPRLKDAAQSAGGVADKLPDKARSAVSSGGELAEQLTERARDVTGLGGGSDGASGGSARSLSPDELSERSEERARHRAKRRKVKR
jgi:hypothetical protein